MASRMSGVTPPGRRHGAIEPESRKPRAGGSPTGHRQMAGQQPKCGGPGVRVNVAAIKAAREAKGWSQAKLAHEIGSDKRVIERIESRGTAALKTIADIAEVCEVPPESLRPSPSESSTFSRGVFQLP